MIPTPDPQTWRHITPTILTSLAETERRGAQLLFVIPVFGVPMLAAAWWGIPSTPVPALIVVAAMVGAFAYVERARRRLRRLPVRWLRGSVTDKRIFQSTNSSDRRVTRRHFITLEAQAALALDRAGALRPATAEGGEFGITAALYEALAVGDAAWVAVMPHDGAIYFAVTSEGTLLGARPTPEPAAP